MDRNYNKDRTKEVTEKNIAKEILQLVELIFNERRKTKPKDIMHYDAPYDDELLITDDCNDMVIKWQKYNSYKDSRDYSCEAYMKKESNLSNIKAVDVEKISFSYNHDGTINIKVKGWSLDDNAISTQKIIAVHKFILKMAREEKIEFDSKINYEKIQN